MKARRHNLDAVGGNGTPVQVSDPAIVSGFRSVNLKRSLAFVFRRKAAIFSYFLLVPVFLTLMSCDEQPVDISNSYRNNFESLWRIIDTQYCYLDAKKVNWDSIHQHYESSLEQDTLSEFIFFDAMEDMLSNLNDGHVNLYSSFDISSNSSWYDSFPANYASGLIYSDRYLGSDYRRVGGFQYRAIAGDSVGYLRYSSFTASFSNQNIYYIFKEFSDCRGLIIDIRDNTGGNADISATLASYFYKRDTVSMYIRHKTGPGHHDFSNPVALTTRADGGIYWGRPVVVLTNRLTYSAANNFVCRMKDSEQVTLLGGKTGGGGGFPISNELPNGWMVRFTGSPTYDGSMIDIESGIEPDIALNLDTTLAKSGVDNIIEKAVSIIMK